MNDSEQLAWEGRNGPKFAVAAFVSALLSLASFVLQIVTFSGASGDREVLRAIDSHHAGVLAGRVAEASAAIFLVVALYFLLRAIRARKPEGLRYLLPVAALAPVLLVIAGVAGYLDAIDAASDFVSGPQTSARAKSLADDLRGPITLGFGQAGGLCLGLTYVLVGVNGMRTGLLSRFMGILGIVSGVLIVLPLVPGGIIQLFWLVALGVLFLDRWPNGRGPAWSVVDDIPWPTAAQVRGLVEEPPTDPPQTAVGPPVEGKAERDQTARTRASRKKKRNRR